MSRQWYEHPSLILQLKDLADTPFVLFPRSHNPGFYDRWINRQDSRGRAFWLLAAAGFRTFVKRIKGRYLVWRYRLV